MYPFFPLWRLPEFEVVASATDVSHTFPSPALHITKAHTFRHTFSTLIHSMGTDLAVQKELLRHADVKTTMNVYTQAVAPAKREAIRKLTKKLMEG
jgi:integrase